MPETGTLGEPALPDVADVAEAPLDSVAEPATEELDQTEVLERPQNAPPSIWSPNASTGTPEVFADSSPTPPESALLDFGSVAKTSSDEIGGEDGLRFRDDI